jgi:hypothetical protein
MMRVKRARMPTRRRKPERGPEEGIPPQFIPNKPATRLTGRASTSTRVRPKRVQFVCSPTSATISFGQQPILDQIHRPGRIAGDFCEEVRLVPEKVRHEVGGGTKWLATANRGAEPIDGANRSQPGGKQQSWRKAQVDGRNALSIESEVERGIVKHGDEGVSVMF